jgi:protein-tyrosine phosphatase
MAEDVLAVFWRVEADYLQRAWQLAERDFGSLHAYLAEGLGVDAPAQRELAARYLAP